ncbi:alkaline phosphatase family protein [Komagataeibacter rhaeticus]|nr:alkaline phosphatase family protein [Komagataeibacter rhaeticus]
MSAATAMAGALPENVRRALAVPPDRRGGGIGDIEHVIILMQENRAFDHYFGCLKGVRGYSDPQPEFLPDGRSPVPARPQGADGAAVPLQYRHHQRRLPAQP